MLITIKLITEEIRNYLTKKISLEELRNWAFHCIGSENVEFEKSEKELISNIIFLIDDESIEQSEITDYLKLIYNELIKSNSIKNKIKNLQIIFQSN